MGVVTWQFSEAPVYQVRIFGGRSQQVQLGRILLIRLEVIDNVGAAVAEVRRDICISRILLKACNRWYFLGEQILVVCVLLLCHAMPRTQMIYDCSQDTVSSPLPV